MGDWMRVYNVADILSATEALRKTIELYCSGTTIVCKDAFSISGISMKY